MIYSLVVLSSPNRGPGARTAAEFAHCLLQQGHNIHRVFFLDDGVYAGHACTVNPSESEGPLERWVELSQKHSVDLVLCITSALRRGLCDEKESERHGNTVANVHPAFAISGLGQLIDAGVASDRMITFGN